MTALTTDRPGIEALRRAGAGMSAARKKRQLSRHAGGYTNAHVARRRQLEPLVATGQVSCCRAAN
jgi:hypothetical protein